MNADLWQKFGARFIGSARARVARARPAIDTRSREGVSTIVTEMHALSGEASMIGVPKIAQLAKSLEAAAKRWNAAQTKEEIAGGIASCVDGLRDLSAAVDALVE